MRFLVNLMFRRLDKLDGPIFGRAYIRGWGGGGVQLIFGMLFVLHIRGTYIRGAAYTGGGVLTGFYSM